MKKSNKINVIAPLTIENAHLVSSVIEIAHEDYGVQRFNYNDQPLTTGFCSSIGTGSNSKVLFEENYKYYGVVSFKDII